MVELSIDPRHKYKAYGQAMAEELSEVRFHLMLPGILDINMVHHVSCRFIRCPVIV